MDVANPNQCKHGLRWWEACSLCGRPHLIEAMAATKESAQAPTAQPSALDRQPGGEHYKGRAIQPIEYIHANGLPFIEGCIVKYATRWRDKGGIQDLEKIIHYAQLLIELEQRKVIA